MVSPGNGRLISREGGARKTPFSLRERQRLPEAKVAGKKEC
jgi:hypothetical protein